MITQNFIKIYENSFKNYWESPALTNYKNKDTLTYSMLAKKIAELHIIYGELGIEKGDKIALIGKNHSTWSTVFLATITYGAVIVPILHEFSPESIEHIINHSEAKCIFVNTKIWETLNYDNIEIPSFSIPEFELLNKNQNRHSNIAQNIEYLFNKKYPDGFKKQDIKYAEVDNSQVVCLNYTSGTTGFSKGVMITANNYAGNITYAHSLNLLLPYEKDLAFLPMAHTYGCAFDFLYALSTGVHVTLLDIMPTPQNLMKAFQEVKPNLIISVPLIFEKIYRSKIIPIINKPVIKILIKTPIINKLIYRKIRKTIVNALGGNFREVIIGGAALGREVEDFFYKIKFPFTVGYGMTECAPLISYDHNYNFVPTSCGTVLKDIMQARIDSIDPINVPGEIQVKGENVMVGYYKNIDATNAAFTNDGWLRTGDLGLMKNNRLYIKGRIKTMILGPNGQNIYPEEIEMRINNLPYIAESLVIKRNNKLIALVNIDKISTEKNNISIDNLKQILENNKFLINKKLANYEKIASMEIEEKEFEKTPKKSIKRFLYN